MTGRSTAWVRPQPIRDAILAYLIEPRSARDIALHIDRPVPTATGHLAAMCRRGLVKHTAYAVYAPPDWPAAAETMGQSARSQPTRAEILEYLTKPRSVREIALLIDRSRKTTGSHLTDMHRRGLIKRVGCGVYALPDSPMSAEPVGAPVTPATSVYSVNEAAPAMSADDTARPSGARVRPLQIRDALYSRGAGPMSNPAQPVHSRALGRRLAPLLTWRRSVRGLSLETGLKTTEIAAGLKELWLRGLVSGDASSGYRLTAAGAHNYSVSVPEEAVSHLRRAAAVLPRAVRRASD